MASLVTQQEAANNTKTEATIADEMRIMGANAVGLSELNGVDVRLVVPMESDPGAQLEPGWGSHFVGRIYAGLLGAGAIFGQHEAAMSAAAAAIKTSFISVARLLFWL